jgi:hypothetical protein
MITITGIIEDASGANLHATLHFVSLSTPLVGAGVITTNSDIIIKSNPADGTFSVPLAAGNYQVLISAGGKTSSFMMAVPAGSGYASIESLVSSPLVYTYSAPASLWNGVWAGSVQFTPLPTPAAPTAVEIPHTGGNVDSGAAHYSYWISFVTSVGETVVSSAANLALTGGVASPDKAISLSWNATPSGVTAVRVWRTFVDAGHTYDLAAFPAGVGLLATLPASTTSYIDIENTAQFAARATAEVPPLYNTTAGKFLDGNGAAMACFTDADIIFPGSNIRVKRNTGLQIYNPDTALWHTLVVSGNPPRLGIDAGNTHI